MDIEQLQKENDELKAHVERLRRVIIDATNNGAQLNSGAWVYSIDDSVIDETTAQSLRHIESRVEEETIERHVDQIRKKIDSVSYDVVKDALEYIAELFEVQPRKYKEQSNED